MIAGTRRTALGSAGGDADLALLQAALDAAIADGGSVRRRARRSPRPAISRPVRAELKARAPLAEAERKAQNLETQIATLSKLLNAGTGGFWPAVTEEISVAKGYEAALGAALGDDLDASTNACGACALGRDRCLGRSGFAAWRRSAREARHGAAPLTRRLNQIGIVLRERRRRLAGTAETWSKAGLEGRRSVALGRFHASRRSAHSGGTAACRKKPPRRPCYRSGSRARRRQRLESRCRARATTFPTAAATEGEARQGA